jgi:hypothetical protein
MANHPMGTLLDTQVDHGYSPWALGREDGRESAIALLIVSGAGGQTLDIPARGVEIERLTLC